MKHILSLFLILFSFSVESQSAMLPTTPKTVTIELTRPTNTIAYSAQQSVANAISTNTATPPQTLTFSPVSNLLPGHGYITKALLITDQATCTARFRLHLFSGTITAIGDTATYTSLYSNNSVIIGYIDFAACSTEGTGSTKATSQNLTIKMPFNLPTGSNTIYGLFETLDAFTPNSRQKFFIQLTTDSN